MATTTHTDSVYMTSQGVAWVGSGRLTRVMIGTATTTGLIIEIQEGITTGSPIIAKVSVDPQNVALSEAETKVFEIDALFTTGIFVKFTGTGWVTLIID